MDHDAAIAGTLSGRGAQVAPPEPSDRLRGVMLGGAVGDAIGLPAEGLSRNRVRRVTGGVWRHRLVLGRGMTSDDTDHAVFVAQSLLAHPGDANAFARRLAWALRWWVLSVPAGIGLGTLRAILKLWLGADPQRSGVQSAGNGPAMRTAPIGAFFAGDRERRSVYVAASTRLTHRDRRALVGAGAVAELVAWTIRCGLRERPSVTELAAVLRAAGPDDAEWDGIVAGLTAMAALGASVEEFAEQMGLGRGVTGYVYHTVPVAVYAWHRHFGSYRDTVEAVLNCGGDTDTTGAIAGALAGAAVGERGIPAEWVRGLVDWPRSTAMLRRLGDRLSEAGASGSTAGPVRYCWPGVVPRNAFFLGVVLAHGFRRLAPPYGR